MSRRILWIVLLCFLYFPAAAQTANSNTLLWRISGRGLQKPSYLFGTMHVNDKKAFNFRDSLYAFIERADAFAMEFHPDSANAVLSAWMNGELTEEPEDEDDTRATGKNAAGENTRAPRGGKKRSMQQLMRMLMNNGPSDKNPMATFMDAYLYEVAKRAEKQIFGLEQVSDQIAALKALRGGMQAERLDDLLEQWNPADGSPVHALYLKEDIAGIDRFFRTYFADSALNIFLYQRNRVMVQQMDSLMQSRSLFTAVGAGHLPGTRGLLSLLQARGYTVEPVLSPGRLAADQYKMKEGRRSAFAIQNKVYGFEYELPAVPKVQEGSRGTRIAFHYDLGGGMVYVVTCGRIGGAEQKKAVKTVIKAHLEDAAKRTGSTLISSADLAMDSVKGMEALYRDEKGNFLRHREWVRGHLFYLLTLTSASREALYSPAAETYFSSFRLLGISPTAWENKVLPEDGFEVAFPSEQHTEEVKLTGEATSKLSWRTHSAFDGPTGTYYSVSVSKTLAGLDLVDNGNFFAPYLDNVRENAGTQELLTTDTTISGFPAIYFRTPQQDNMLEGIIIRRNNISYFAVADYDRQATGQGAARFLASFRLAPFRAEAWQQAEAPGAVFSVWAPGSIRIRENEGVADTSVRVYYSYHPVTAANYYISSTPVSPYFWAAHIDTLYRFWLGQKVNNWSDTVLYNRPVTNGGLAGREVEILHRADSSRSRMRLLLNGPNLYTLSAEVPAAFYDAVNTDRFFASFVLKKEESSSITANSPEPLFADLQSADSATFGAALEALDQVYFTPADLPLLLQKVLAAYRMPGEEYADVRLELLEKAAALAGTGAAQQQQLNAFIEKQYPLLDTTQQGLRYPMLRLLARDSSAAAYAALKRLFFSSPPPGDWHYGFFYALSTHPRQAKHLFPEMLQYLGDATLGSAVVSLVNTLIDSGQLEVQAVSAHKALLLQLAEASLKRGVGDDASEIADLITLLGRFNQPDANAVVSRFLQVQSSGVQYAAATALLKNNLPVTAAVLQKIAADKRYRTALYAALKKHNRPVLFPAAYRTQQSMAQSYIYTSLDEEDWTEPEFIFIKKIETEYKGSRKRFFLYRLNFTYDRGGDETVGAEQTESYLAIAGPFDMDEKKIDLDAATDVSGMYYNSPFDGYRLEEMFRNYLAQTLQYNEAP